MTENNSTTNNNNMNIDYLATINKHPRDKHVVFIEKDHYYLVRGNSYKSVTTIIKPLYGEFNSSVIVDSMINNKNNKKIYDPDGIYYGMNKQEILNLWDKNGKEASMAGTNLHYDIECVYNNNDIVNESIEFSYFNKFKEDYSHLTPYRTEWIVYYEKYKLAGSIDMVFINSDGNLLIYDWKRCKDVVPEHDNEKYPKWMDHDAIRHMPDNKYWHYVLQLNIYKYIIEHKYNKIVVGLFLVILHPTNSNYIRKELPIIGKEIKQILADHIVHPVNTSTVNK